MYNIECLQSTLEVDPDYDKEKYRLNILAVSFVSSIQIKIIITNNINIPSFSNDTHFLSPYTVCLQMNGAVSKVNKKFISHLTRAQRTSSAAATVQVSHALPAVRFSCLLRGRRVSLQDGAAAGKGFLCAPF